MMIYTVLSRLLDYPDQELKDNLGYVHNIVNQELKLESEERHRINQVLEWMKGKSLLQLQEYYVDTFDTVPEHSLHLTHHLFGDDRGRGPALVDLGEHYKGDGLEMKGGEIPDFLPLILEYVATLDELEARMFLADAAKVLTVLATNLEAVNSPYAALLRIAENRGHLAKTAA